MDILEEIASENVTNQTWSSNPSIKHIEEALYVTWSLICIIPNLLLIYLILKNRAYHINFYFVIFHLTIFNLITLVFAIYYCVYKYVSFLGMHIIMVDETVKFAAVVLRLLFIVDKIQKSNTICYLTLYGVWPISGLLIIVEIVCLLWQVWTVFTVLFAIMEFSILAAIIIVIIKAIVSCARCSHEETFGIRLMLAGAYILTLSIQWIYIVMLYTSLATSGIIIYFFFDFVLYGNGFINLILLVCYEPQMKRYFYQQFNRNVDYYDVHFSERNSDAQDTSEPTTSLNFL